MREHAGVMTDRRPWLIVPVVLAIAFAALLGGCNRSQDQPSQPPAQTNQGAPAPAPGGVAPTGQPNQPGGGQSGPGKRMRPLESER